MMTWVTLLYWLIRLASKYVEYLERQRLIEETEAKVAKELLKEVDDVIKKADANRRNVAMDADSLQSDPRNLDRRTAGKAANENEHPS